jgi:hypothetical protein
MTQCKECGHQVSTKAEACPGCGAKQPKSSGCLKFVVIGVVLLCLPAILVVSRARQDSIHTVSASGPVEPRPEPRPVPVNEPAATPTASPQGAQWSYVQSDDAMGKGVIRTARVRSSNEVEFDFPYAGAQRATLTLRMHPRYGKDVIFGIERGQIQCPSYDDCTVLVRFDDEAPSNFAAVGAQDNSSETIFIRNYDKFLAKLTKAKRLRLSASIFRQGSPVFDFDLSAFDSRKYKGEPLAPASKGKPTHKAE